MFFSFFFYFRYYFYFFFCFFFFFSSRRRHTRLTCDWEFRRVLFRSEVDRQHPYSDWARKSLLMSAYASYNAGDYDGCIGSATRYVTLHPGSPDAAYAQYLIAASHYDQDRKSVV